MSASPVPHEARSGTGIVLLHGAGLGAWIWRDLVPRLAAPSLAVGFPGRGRPFEERRGLSLDDYAGSVAAQIRAFAPPRLVLVAHSVAGILIPRVAHEFPDRTVGVVAVAAAIPPRGGSFLDSLPAPQRVLTGAIMRILGTRPPEAAIRKGLCSELAASTADEVVERFDPESRSLYRSRVRLPLPDLPMVYLRLTRDQEFGLSLQDRMARNLNAAEVIDFPSGHMPMLSRPAELARVIDGIVATL